jgi:hypothetical protein
MSSTDDGRHWKLLDSSDQSKTINTLAIIRNKIFAGCDWGLFFSSDSGSHWQQCEKPIGNTTILCLSAGYSGLSSLRINALLANENTVFASTWETGGIFRTTLPSAHWTKINSGMETVDIRELALCGTVLLAETSKGVFRSADNGMHWNVVIDSSKAKTGWSHIAIEKKFVVVGTPLNGMFFSTDSGSTWENVALDTGDIYGLSLTLFSGSLFAWSRTKGILISRDTGLHWSEITWYPSPPQYIEELRYSIKSLTVAAGAVLALTVDGCIYRAVSPFNEWIKIDSNAINYSINLAANTSTLFRRHQHWRHQQASLRGYRNRRVRQKSGS